MLDLIENLISKKNLLDRREIPDLKGSLFSIYLELLAENTGKKVVFIPSSSTKKETLKNDLNCPEFPQFSLTSTLLEPHIKTKTEFFDAFYRFFIENEKIAIANPCFFLLPLPDISKNFFNVKVSDELNPETLKSFLSKAGYIQTDIVREAGEYAFRGNIVDFFPFSNELPVRVEIDFDEVESIKLFDPISQKSVKVEREVIIYPIFPLSDTEKHIEKLKQKLKNLFNKPELKISLKEKLEQIEKHRLRDFFYLSLSILEDKFFQLFENTIFIFENKKEFEDRIEGIKNDIERQYLEETKNGYLSLPYKEVFRDLKKLKDFFKEKTIEINPSDTTLISSIPPIVKGKIDEITNFIKEKLNEGAKVILSSPNEFYLKKSEELLFENSIPFSKEKEEKGVNLIISKYSSNFAISNNIIFLSFLGLFPEKKKEKKKTRFSSFFSDFSDIKKGDYVVHIEYGIAKYLGTKTLEIENSLNEMVELEFANDTKVFVPVSKIHLLQKYKDYTAESVSLSNIASKQWERTKKKVQREIESYAKELLTLYAERKMAKGISFSPPSSLYREFEDAFEYTETEDQLSAINDINRDLEASYPMDRLLCGDVGFGKTEVAMRACFRAVESGYQVLVLSPTTVLTFQHFERFKKRFELFPIEIEMLSRFVSSKKQREIIERFARGEIDILIGTHRILSKDIIPKNLGLIIVDEEQRFGVLQKEKLKYLKKSVNVLSMTATPIPRTLNMSVMGLKDISIIETPPKNRLAVDTYHIVFDPTTIKKAIEFELKRDGQVYFVHNRIETIEQVTSIIKSLVPEAKVNFAHGKMGEEKLERIMLKFFKKEIDILVTTTIIENGMDVKDANTMFINDAQNFGLSQLYQLRGRIGRSDKPAFCYLITSGSFSLTKEARKRIEALEEFSYLGAGFRISMFDLELRGAGEILGTKQSGHINSVGIELYTKMLEKTVEKLKNKEFVEEETILEHPFIIPKEYIEVPSVRLSFYRKLSIAREYKDLLKVTEEMEDRFGKLPEKIELLISAHKIRIEGRKLGIKSIELKKSVCTLVVSDNSRLNIEKLVEEVNKNPFIEITPDGKIVIHRQKNRDLKDFLSFILELLKKIENKQ
ncbi:transcription-repair coupling factor [Thermotomaculum hydrothermale]|uniref:Transcription-repair-coupling factor n=1 Tax=Thermotomaculum hydrothermale TaxID=981385 RepID=A0A7R6PPG8_9BACT|nr:transcription-repair coupling factor [Thermotomaculum hydrothermale]BBB32886.1 transcription-repair coupling factor [Thermotomaculum hydrothermale]